MNKLADSWTEVTFRLKIIKLHTCLLQYTLLIKLQAKQKRNNRKGRDKGRDERSSAAVLDKHQEENPSNEKKGPIIVEVQPVINKPDILEDLSDVSDSVDGAAEVLQLDSEDRDASPVNWDTDTSEVHPPAEASGSGVSGLSSIPNGSAEKRSTCAMDDSSSTCSTDSVPSVVNNGFVKGNSHSSYRGVKSPSRYIGKHVAYTSFSNIEIDI